jgi:REP element-mobilizing transposase RayT
MSVRTRGYLPHLEIPEGTYFVTFRLADSLPTALLVDLKTEPLMKKSEQIPSVFLEKNKYVRKIELLLDIGAGECFLRDPRVASLVMNALREFNEQQYFLHAWTVMPNHVHVLFTLEESVKLSSIMQKLKGSTSFQANRLLNRSGRFWQPEYFDRLIRTKRQFEFYLRYILNNPVKAGLCLEASSWPWSGCSANVHYLANRFFAG